MRKPYEQYLYAWIMEKYNMKSYGAILLLIICLSLPVSSYTRASPIQRTEEIELRIERIVNGLLPKTAFQNQYDDKASLVERMAYYKTPGVSIAVVNEYRIEWARGFGVCEWGKSDPVTETTLFQAGSISKPIFALGIMRLVQEGRLNLDEDVNSYLKSWKVPVNRSWQPKITLRQILSHSAGLTVHGFPGYMRTEEIPSVVQILDGETPSNTPPILVNIIPGIQHRYSGGGITLAQQVTVDVVGKSFPEIMFDLVLNPLGMNHSTYEQPLPKRWAKTASTGHPWKYQAIKGKWHVYPEMAAAGLWTTASDLAKVGFEIQRVLKGESEFLSKDITIQMLTPQTGDDNGMGFFLQGEGETVRFGHGGWDEGFVARLTMYKNVGMGAVIMINSNQGAALISEIERAIAREYDWPDYFPKEKIVIKIPQEALQLYVGEYITESNVELKVNIEGESLFLQPAEQPPIKLYSESETEFFMKVVNADITFEKSKDGKVTGLKLNQRGKHIEAKRKEVEE